MQRLIYTVIFYIALPLYFLRLIFRGFQNPNYLKRWRERLGFGSNLPSEGKVVLWIHAVSVGEVNASIPLVRSFLDDYPNSEILVTTSTPTGSKILLDKMGIRVKHQYVPLDLPFCINAFLDRWNPKAFIVLETEIWPNIYHFCGIQDIPLILASACISDNSMKKYSILFGLFKDSVSQGIVVASQSEEDAQKFISLGAKD